MQLTIELQLKTREVYRLFELKINGKHLFIDSVFRKIHRIHLVTPEIHRQVEQELRELIAKFTQKTVSFEKMLDRNKSIKAKAVDVIPQFHFRVIVTNKLGLLLVEFIELYDNLIALMKLLHLSGCFDSNEAYNANIRNVKKMGNRMLSDLLLLRTIKNNRIKIHVSNQKGFVCINSL